MCEGLKMSSDRAGLKPLWVWVLGQMLWYRGGVGTQKGVLLLHVTWKWSICLGVRTGPLPGEDTLFPFPSSGLPLSGLEGCRGEGVRRGGQAFAFNGWFGSRPLPAWLEGSGSGAGA